MAEQTAPASAATKTAPVATTPKPATAATAVPQVSPEQKLADTNKAINALKTAGIAIPESLTADVAKYEREIKNEELKKKYDKLVAYLSAQATAISNLGLDLGDYNIAISVAEKDGAKTVSVSAKGGVRAASTSSNGGAVGKGRKVKVGGKEFASAKEACDHLGLEVKGDSAIRVLNKNKVEFTYVD